MMTDTANGKGTRLTSPLVSKMNRARLRAVYVASVGVSLFFIFNLEHHARAENVSGACHRGAAWHARDSGDGSAYVTLTPCGREEPADIIALTCSSKQSGVSGSVDFVPSGRSVPSNITVLVDGRRRYTLPVTFNNAGLYETLDFELDDANPLVKDLATSDRARLRVGRKSTRIHLRGSGKAIKAMLAGCGRTLDGPAPAASEIASSSDAQNSPLPVTEGAFRRVAFDRPSSDVNRGRRRCRNWNQREFAKLRRIGVEISSGNTLERGERVTLKWRNPRGLMDPKRGTFLMIDIPDHVEAFGSGFETYRFGTGPDGVDLPFYPRRAGIRRLSITLGYRNQTGTEPKPSEGTITLRPGKTGPVLLKLSVHALRTFKIFTGAECAGLQLTPVQDVRYNVIPPTNRFDVARNCHLSDATQAISARVSMKTDRASVGKPARLKWQLSRQPSQRCRTPLYLVLSFPERVRLGGNGFVALTPGTAGPFGIRYDIEKLRVFVPLGPGGYRTSGALDFRAFLSGKLDVRWSLIEVPARTNKPISVSDFDGANAVIRRTDQDRLFVKLETGTPTIVVQNRQATTDPDRIIDASAGPYRLQVYSDFYRVIDTTTGELLLQRDGRNPGFSATGRFVSALTENGNALEIVDLFSGDIAASFRSEESGSYIGRGVRPVAWGRNDSFVMFAPWFGDGILQNIVTDSRPITVASTGFKGHRPDLVFASVDLEALTLTYMQTPDAARPVYASLLREGSGLRKDGSHIARQGLELLSTKLPNFNRSTYRWHLGDDTRLQKFDEKPLASVKQHLAQAEKQVPINYTRKQRRDWLRNAEKYHREALREAARLAPLFLDNTTNNRTQPPRVASTTSQNSAVRSAVSDVRAETTATGIALSRIKIPERVTELTGLVVSNNATKLYEAGSFLPATYGPDEGKPVRPDETLSKVLVEHVNGADYRRALDSWWTSRGGEKLRQARLGLRDMSESFACDYDVPASMVGQFVVPGRIVARTHFQIAQTHYWMLQQDCWGGSGWQNAQLGILVKRPNKTPEFQALSRERTDEDGTLGLNSNKRVRGWLTEDEKLIVALPNRALLIHDVARRKRIVLRTNVAGTEVAGAIHLAQDKKTILKIDDDGRVAVFRLGENRPLLSGFTYDDELVLYTDAGYYAATPEGAHFVYMKFPGVPGLHTFHQFARSLDRPDIIRKAVSRQKISERAKVELPPALTVTFQAQDDGTIDGSYRISSTLSVERVQIYQDGVLSNTLALQKEQNSGTFQIKRIVGARWVSLLAIDASGTVSLPVGRDLGPDQRGSTRIVSLNIGIDAYADESLKLDGAATDARRVNSAIASLNPRENENVWSRVVTDADATRSGLVAAFRDAVAHTRYGDTLVISYAGHGLRGANGQFYLTSYETTLDNVTKTGITWSELGSILKQSKGRIIILLDACQAGVAGTNFFATNDEAASELLSDVPSNIAIFAASKGREFSFEAGDVDGGVFSKSLAEVITTERDKHDLNGNGAIEISELFVGVKRKVVIGGRTVREALADEQGSAEVLTQTPWLARNQMIGDFAAF